MKTARAYTYAEALADDVVGLNATAGELAAIDLTMRAVASGTLSGERMLISEGLGDARLYQIGVGRFKLNYTLDDKLVRLLSIIV